MVAMLKGHLTCTCKAGQNGILCKHRALVYARLTAEANARRRADAAGRETAPLYRDNRPLSIWK
jgi:hypothetical protein